MRRAARVSAERSPAAGPFFAAKGVQAVAGFRAGAAGTVSCDDKSPHCARMLDPSARGWSASPANDTAGDPVGSLECRGAWKAG